MTQDVEDAISEVASNPPPAGSVGNEASSQVVEAIAGGAGNPAPLIPSQVSFSYQCLF